MLEKIGERVSVNLVYNHATGEVSPRYMKWKNSIHKIQKVGLHYTLFRGNKLIHMFSACDTDHYFLLAFDTQTLHWTLEEVADNQVN